MTEPTPIRHHRRYTKRQKVAAVVAAEMASAAAAADQTGIPERTIRHWQEDPRMAELAAKTRDEVADGFRVLTGLAIDRLAQMVPTMEARDLIIMAGVSVDKGQLLSGQATERSETMTSGLDDHEKAKLKEIIVNSIMRVAK